MNLVTGYHVLPSMRDYWSSDPDLSVPFIANVMPSKRFEKIRSLLHFNNNESMRVPSDPLHDRAFNVRLVLDYFNESFASAMPPSQSGKPVGDAKSYRRISLLCVPYKILEKLIYARVEPLIDPLLPKEQAGFRRGKSTVDQVVLLIQNIEDSFEAKKKAGAVFIDLTAAYDTVWHRGLTCKLLRLLPDKHMVKMIMELVRN